MNREVLCRPFPAEAVRTRPGAHGKTVSYVDIAAVITRLNEGCDAWSFEVVSHKVEADEVIVLGKLTADGVVKMAFGGSAISLDKEGKAVSIADDLKASSSDSLKKCASLLGVALEMYGGASPANGNGRTRERAPEPDDRVTARQLADIQAACRRRSIGREELLALIAKQTGKRTGIQYLTKAEASAVIDELGTGNGTAAH